MPLESFSAKRLDELLASIADGPTIGLDLIRDIAVLARSITREVDDPARGVVAWILMKQMDALCDRFDGDPMSVVASERVAHGLRTVVRDSLELLSAARHRTADEVLDLAAELIALECR